MSRRRSATNTNPIKKPLPKKSNKQCRRRRPNKSQSQSPPSTSSQSVINNNPVIENLKQENDKFVAVEQNEDGPKRFYGCYLLTSLSPRFKGHSYIGFTVNPKRRIRQHNGEITCGAFRTKKKRPWEMILCIHGFPSHTSALQFEWAWQHPRESLAVREAAASFKTLGGLANKIKLAITMLTLHSWQSMNLTVSFFSTKYMNHAAGCPSLPQQMKLHFCSMDELPCYSDYPHGCDDEDDFDSNDSEISANYSDDRVEASADDSMEMNLPSDHLQSCTVQYSNDSFLAGDQTCGSWEFEPYSVMSVPEELMQPVHQLPVDISGSMLNTSNELLWPGEVLWNEDDRGSFSDLEERIQPTGSISTSENNIFPALEEKQPLCPLPADVPISTWNDSSEQIRLRNEAGGGTEELRNSVHVIEEQIQPSQQLGGEREQSAMVGLISVIEDAAKKDETTCIIIDDIDEEQCQPKRIRSPLKSSNTHRAFSTEGIEVIELCTPSPDFRITNGRKKRRANSGFPDIIDLTRSPSFVQL